VDEAVWRTHAEFALARGFSSLGANNPVKLIPFSLVPFEIVTVDLRETKKSVAGLLRDISIIESHTLEVMMRESIRKCTKVLFVALLGAVLAAATSSLSTAGDHEGDCRKRIHVAEQRLQKAIDKHGEHSPEADRCRHDLDEVHRDCADVH
jgi:hypothetical protein